MTSEEYKEQLSEALGKLAGVHAVGDSWITFDGSIPAGGVPFTGQLVTRAMYADLWAWVQANKTVVTDAAWQTTANAQNGMNAAYSSGDGSTTFRLPCVVGGYLCAGDTSTAGGYVKEGLPGLNGSFTAYTYGTGDPTGIMKSYPDTVNVLTFGSSEGTRFLRFDFDASRSSSIYGNSQHVTPETFKVMVGVYAFGVNGAVGESTEAGLVAEMNHKADTDASNFSDAGKNVLAGMGMPSGRYIDLTLGASGTTYTAPANGYILLRKGSPSANNYINLLIETKSGWVLVDSAVWSSSEYTWIKGVFAGCKKGQRIQIDYNTTGSTDSFQFIYAEGAS